MGLPPPEVDNIVSWRNFGLAHSIRSVYLNVSSHLIRAVHSGKLKSAVPPKDLA